MRDVQWNLPLGGGGPQGQHRFTQTQAHGRNSAEESDGAFLIPRGSLFRARLGRPLGPEFRQSRAFVNELLLEHGPVNSFTCCLWWLSCDNGRMELL